MDEELSRWPWLCSSGYHWPDGYNRKPPSRAGSSRRLPTGKGNREWRGKAPLSATQNHVREGGPSKSSTEVSVGVLQDLQPKLEGV